MSEVDARNKVDGPGATNPTLPIHQIRERWGSQFKTFREGWATFRLSELWRVVVR